MVDLLLRRRIITGAKPSIKPVQIIQNGNFADGTTGWDVYSSNYMEMTVSSGVFELTKTISQAGLGAIAKSRSAAGNIYTTHVYYIAATVKAGSVDVFIGFSSNTGAVNNNPQVGSNSTDWERIDVLGSPRANNAVVIMRAGASASPAGSNGYFQNYICIDLTATFGAGNEPDLATCRTLFPDDYYPYYNPS